MEEILRNMKRAAAAVQDLPDDLRPVAFRYVLERYAKEGGASVGRSEAGGERRPRGRRRGVVTLSGARIKEFAGSKNPRNHEQRVVVIAAYFLREGITRIGEEHLRKAYTALRWKRPGNMRQILCNVHCRKGWMSEAGPDGWRELTEIGREYVESM